MKVYLVQVKTALGGRWRNPVVFGDGRGAVDWCTGQLLAEGSIYSFPIKVRTRCLKGGATIIQLASDSGEYSVGRCFRVLEKEVV